MSYRLDKQKNGLYKIRVWSNPDEFGKIKTKQESGIRTVAVAKNRALEIEELLNQNIIPKDYTFENLCKLYYKAKEKTLSPNTIDKKKFVRNSVLNYWGTVLAKNINTRNVQDWVNKLEQKENVHKPGAKLKKSTIQEYVKFLNTILNWAVSQDYLEYNRIKKLEYTEDEEEFEPTILPPETLSEILMSFKKECYNLYIPSLLSLLLDPRRGEVTALTWDNVDFENGLIRLNKTAYEENGQTKFKNKMKSKTSKRILVMSEFLKNELLEHKQMNAHLNSNLVCANVFIGNIKPSYVSHKFHDFVKDRFGILMRFHDLRHNFNQLCYESGTDLSTRSKMMGHSNEKITNQVYTHFSQNKAKEAVENMANLLNLKPTI